jgi:Fic family protein
MRLKCGNFGSVEFRPKFTISNLILNHIASIEAAREVILAAPLVPRYEMGFRREAVARTVYHGTHIEGSPLGEETVREVLAGGIKERQQEIGSTTGRGRERHFQEVINYQKVLDFIEAVVENRPSVLKRRFRIDNLKIQNAAGRFALTEDVIGYLHRLVVERLVPPAEAGKYRKVAVVLRNSISGRVSFHPPAWQEVPNLMEAFAGWVNSDEAARTHAVLKAGVIHYELARIHPFTEGNGRTARAAATMSLFMDGYDIRRFFSLEEYFDRNPNDYFGALQETSNQLVEDESERDLTGWLEYFSRGVAEEFKRVKEKVQRLSLDVRLKGRLGRQIELSERQVKLIEFMEKQGRLRNEDFRTVLPMVSEDTVRRDLGELIRCKLVVKKGRTKAARYELRGG